MGAIAAATAAMARVAAMTNRKAPRANGPDGITVMLLAVAAFLVIFAALAWQLRSAPGRPPRRVVLMRRVYETRVVETVVGRTGGGTSMTQSASSSVPASSPAPVTRSS